MHLEQALLQCHLGLPLIPQVPYGREDSKEVLEATLEMIRRQTQTPTLVCLFSIALAFKTGDIIQDPTNQDHTVAQFLFKYFIDKPYALHYICDISVNMIGKTRGSYKAILAA